jgi:protein gp37
MYRDMERYGQDPTKVRRTSEAKWREPFYWQREALQTGRTRFVFTCSWSDFFNAEADGWRAEAWDVIRSCPNLCFQILTKLPERILDHLPDDWDKGYRNLWLGTSIENNDYVWRADELRKVPAVLRFISAEPLLGPLPDLDLAGIGWLIAGGESGSGFRPMDHAWARDLRDRCQRARIPFYFKQSAAVQPESGKELDGRRHEDRPIFHAPTPTAVQVRRLERLRALESEIRDDYEAFYRVGMKLKEIRDDQLYKDAGFVTWEAYCRECWDFSGERARQLIVAAEYRTVLPAPTNVGEKDKKDRQWNEAAVRELTRLEDKRDAATVAAKVVKAVEQDDVKLTAATVRKFVDEELGIDPRRKKKTDADLPDLIDLVRAYTEKLQRQTVELREMAKHASYLDTEPLAAKRFRQALRDFIDSVQLFLPAE